MVTEASRPPGCGARASSAGNRVARAPLCNPRSSRPGIPMSLSGTSPGGAARSRGSGQLFENDHQRPSRAVAEDLGLHPPADALLDHEALEVGGIGDGLSVELHQEIATLQAG